MPDCLVKAFMLTHNINVSYGVMSMKKIKVASILAIFVVLLLFFTGCEQDELFSNKQPSLKVGLLLDTVGRDAGSFNDAAYNGLKMAENQFGGAIETTLSEQDDVNKLEKELRDLAKGNMDLIIAVGYYYSEPLLKVAPDYPQTKFVLIDNTLPDLKAEGNITCVTFKDNEGSFLAGAAAALKSKSGIIGFVGGTDNPVIKNFETGYTAGAAYINPDIKVLINYVARGNSGFNSPDLAKDGALEEIGKGADVIFHAAGASGEGVFEAVTSRKKLAIGADVDQTYVVPQEQRAYILTSIIKGVDMAVLDVIERALEDRLEGGYVELGIKEGVEIYAENEVNQDMLSDIKDRLDEIKDKIVSGEITVPSYNN